MILRECLYDFISFYFKFSNLFQIYTNLHKYVLNLFENMLTAGLPHTATPLASRTLPRAQPDNLRLMLRTLLHTATLPDTAVRFATHCRTLHEFECRTPHNFM
jgi:hypothetical protein